MSGVTRAGRMFFFCQTFVLLCAVAAGTAGIGTAQDNSSKSQESTKADDSSTKKSQDTSAAKPADSQIVGDTDQPAPPLPTATTREARTAAAWKILSDSATESKKPQTRIEALSAIGLLRTPQSEKLLREGMQDSDVDVRTAAILAAGQSRDGNLIGEMRSLLDDKEPQVAFTAAMTLSKMGDRSGEDILMSVVDGDRKTSAGLMHGTQHKISRDLHDPAKMAKLGAVQGAYFLLGPFGYGITAFQFLHQGGGDLSRASAIEELSQEPREPVRRELVEALGDKDTVVRVAALKGLIGYRDKATSDAVYPLLADNKLPVRLTAASVYLRTMGTPGPAPMRTKFPPERSRSRVQLPKPGSTAKVP